MEADAKLLDILEEFEIGYIENGAGVAIVCTDECLWSDTDYSMSGKAFVEKALKHWNEKHGMEGSGK